MQIFTDSSAMFTDPMWLFNHYIPTFCWGMIGALTAYLILSRFVDINE